MVGFFFIAVVYNRFVPDCHCNLYFVIVYSRPIAYVVPIAGTLRITKTHICFKIPFNVVLIKITGSITNGPLKKI